jgi:ankyrin repeat protein
MLIDIARREAKFREAIAILRDESSHTKLFPPSGSERVSQGKGLDYSYRQSRKPSKRTLTRKIHDLSFGRMSVCTESSTESSESHQTNRQAKRFRVGVDFVPSSTFWQTMIHLRLEWAARLDSLTAPMFSLQFLDVVLDYHPIIRASIRGDLCKLADLVSGQGVSPFCSTTAGWTPLHYAAAYGQMDACRLLRAQGAPLCATGVRGITPLHLAAHFGRFQIFKALMKAGSDPDEYHEHGLNAIFEILSNEAVSNSPDLATFLKWLFHGQEQFVLDTEAKDNSKRGILYHVAYPPGWTSHSTRALTTIQSKTIELVLSEGARGDELDIHETSVLHAACRDGRLDLVERLVPRIYNIDAMDRRGYTPLHCAVESRKFELVSVLVREGSDINAVSHKDVYDESYDYRIGGCTPLSLAAAQNWVEMVEYLLQHGAGYRDEDVSAAFRVAVRTSRASLKTVQYFIENEIDRLNFFGIVNEAGNNSSVIEVLCMAGADIDAEGPYGWTSLGTAARWGWDDLAKKLVELGADIDKLTCGLTPLGHAAEGGHGDIVQLLLTAGAQTELTGDQMPTPWQLATSHGYGKMADNIARHTDSRSTRLIDTLQPDIAEQVIDVAEASPAVDWDLEAAAINGDLEVVEKLIEKNCTLKAGKRSVWSPLHMAINRRHWAVATRLVQAGAELNECDKDDKGRIDRPFMEAVCLENVAFIELMIRHGADVNISDHRGSTPLLQSLDLYRSYLDLTSEGCCQKACYSNGEVVRVLLSAGANVNAIDDFGRTPLGKAASIGNFDAVVALVEAGAELNKPSSQNKGEPIWDQELVYRTPLAWAALMGHENVVRYLFDAGAEWRSLQKEPALSYTHRLLMQSWFPDDAEAPSDSVPCVELLSVFPEDATGKSGCF